MSVGEVILKGEKLHRSYTIGESTLEVLHGVSIDVRAGETLSIMGESGSGKSTLLHVLGGLDRPMSGKVSFQGQDVYAMNEARRSRFRAQNVGLVFQSFHLLPELDILENVALPAMALGKGAGAKERAADLLKEVGLEARIGHLPRELSGGERQRVAIARALMNEPDVILADEPTGNLDSKTGDKVLHYLFQLIEARRHTLLLVTHSHAVASRCARQVVLQDGVLV
jgi:putative ABC transport system ATP-binding protein